METGNQGGNFKRVEHAVGWESDLKRRRFVRSVKRLMWGGDGRTLV